MEFDKFSSQSFETLIQALCSKIFGPGIVIFGSGRDGGREASFDGKIPFPSAVDNWNGYTIVQAKHRERLRKNVEDADWLAAQLDDDLYKFSDKKRNLKKPQYYLIASNVTLSSIPDIGGKSKIDAIFKKHQSLLGIKGYAVWSTDELTALLADASDIRTQYTAWLTPGDVLGRLIMKLESPNLSRIAPLSIIRDLRDDRDVRLRDAGQETEKPVFLEDVFIDLPMQSSKLIFAQHSDQDDLGDSDERTPQTLRVVQQLTDRLKLKLDPEAIKNITAGKGKGRPLPNRIVILGGPGQGKSTLGQFLCQIVRSRLVNAQPEHTISPQILDIITPINNRAASEGISQLGPIRFPFRVDLPTYADLLKKAQQNEDDLSILDYMTKRMVRNTNESLLPGDLRRWLGTCPALIVLDGLDEVPQTANRKELLQAIDTLWDSLLHEQADALMVVTSRPQGFNNDLDARYWEHWELSSLDLNDSLRFAGRLSEVRLSDTEKREAIISELARASEDAATKLLMTTPLQVAILFGIALLKGAIPQDRWDLFERYYTLLRDREAQKPGSTSALFRDFKRQIDAIHRRVGFILQVTAESAGSSSAYLSTTQFNEVIGEVLADDDYESSEISRITALLAKVATERLVLLAQRVEGRIAFDVRSLQEYMAAAELTVASAVPIGVRLRPIASNAHWRHVFRIAASRIFSTPDLNHFRDDVIAICHALDSGDLGSEERLAKFGSILALDLLSDGVANSTPKYQRQLVRRALQIIDLGPSLVSDRLTITYNQVSAQIFEAEIRSRLSQVSGYPLFGAWQLIVKLLNNSDIWIIKAVEDFWPSNAETVLQIFAICECDTYPSFIREKLRAAQWEVGPLKAAQFAQEILLQDREEDPELEAEDGVGPLFVFGPEMVRRGRGANRLDINIIKTEEDGSIYSGVNPINAQTDSLFIDSSKAGGEWSNIRSVVKFRENPSKESAANCLMEMSVEKARSYIVTFELPWLIESLLQEICEGANPDSLAASMNAGNFGDQKDWFEAEVRWRRDGIVAADISEWMGGTYITKNIGQKGAPYISTITRSQVSAGIDPEILLPIFEAAKSLSSVAKQRRIIDAVAFGLGRNQSDKSRDLMLEIVSHINLNWLDSMDKFQGSVLLISQSGDICWKNDLFVKMAEQCGKINNRFYWVRNSVDNVISRYLEDSSRLGLLTYVIGFMERSSKLPSGSVDSILAATPPLNTIVEHPVRAAISLLRVASGEWDEEIEVEVNKNLRSDEIQNYFDPLYKFSSTKKVMENPRYDRLLVTMLDGTYGVDYLSYVKTIGKISALANTRKSVMNDRSLLSELCLPSFSVDKNL